MAKKQNGKLTVKHEAQSTGSGLGSESFSDGLSDDRTFDPHPEITTILQENKSLKEENNQLREILNSENNRHEVEYSIVIPYLKSKAQGEELKFALRSIETHFRCMNYNVVIIGDREDWFDDGMIVHIDMPAISNNPQEDVINKIKEVLLSDQVSDKIIWTNDDIYFVSPVESCDIETLKIDGLLKDDGRLGLYSENRRSTIELLKAKKLPLRNFATHTPLMYDKNKLIELFEAIPELNEGGYLFSSVYFNFHYPHHKPTQTDWKSDNWSLRVITAEPSVSTFMKLVSEKKFLNNSESGYGSVVVDYLEKTFTESGKYEA